MFRDRTPGWLVGVNIATTVLHYVDNILYFHEYPEPSWISPKLVDGFWFLMTPVAFLGLWLMRRHPRGGRVTLAAYAVMSLLVLGHYRFAPFHAIGFRIHAFIWIEAAAALLLLTWLLVTWRRPTAGAWNRPPTIASGGEP